MKKNILILSLLLLMMITNNSCHKNDNPLEPVQTKELLPLSKGNQWKYMTTFFDTLGNIEGYDSLVINVLRDTTIGDEKWYISSDGIYRNGTNGLWYMYFNTPAFIYKYPATSSDTFFVDNHPILVLSTSEDKSVPSGNFSCYHYFNTYFKTNDYYSPGIGRVSFENCNLNSVTNKWYVDVRNDLISYHIQ